MRRILKLLSGIVGTLWILGLACVPVLAQCEPWAIVPSPNPGATFNKLFDVKALAADDIWAVGYHMNNGVDPGRRSLIVHWDGQDWTVVESPNPGRADNVLTGIAAVAPDDIWAVGVSHDGDENAQQTLTLHWDGTAWSVISSPNPDRNSVLVSVTIVSPDDVWAVGYQGVWGRDLTGRQPMALHWDGLRWAVVATPSFPDVFLNDLTSVAAVANDDVWAVGEVGWPTPFQTLVLHFDGTAWTRVPSPSPGSRQSVLEAVMALATDDVWAVGFQYLERVGRRTLTEHWDGREWIVVPSPNSRIGIWSYLLGVAAAAPDDIWAVGFNDRGGPDYPHAMHWDGANWTLVELPDSGISSIARAVAVLPNGEVWVVGETTLSGGWQRTLIQHRTCAPGGNPRAGVTLRNASEE